MNYKYNIFTLSFTALLVMFGCENAERTQSETLANSMWSGIPGDPNFQLEDRLAIKDVMDAYSLYWDNNDVERFFQLFTEDAIRIVSKDGQEDVSILIQERKAKASERLAYFKSKGLQRRHLMANTHFIEQNDSSAYIKQYALLISTENGTELKPVSTIVYHVWLRKIDGIWRISKYNIGFDGTLDVALKSNATTE